MNVTKPQFAAIRAISGISLMIAIGLWGYFSEDLKNQFLDGALIPLIFIIIAGIIMEIVSIFTMLVKKEEANNTSIKPSAIYAFGSTAICVYLALFFVAFENFMAQPPGGSNNEAWAPIIFIAYIGIVAQVYTMYRVLKRENKPL